MIALKWVFIGRKALPAIIEFQYICCGQGNASSHRLGSLTSSVCSASMPEEPGSRFVCLLKVQIQVDLEICWEVNVTHEEEKQKWKRKACMEKHAHEYRSWGNVERLCPGMFCVCSLLSVTSQVKKVVGATGVSLWERELSSFRCCKWSKMSQVWAMTRR